ncbi:MAG: ketopantoate reductase family protein [Prevotella sp.]|jgi:2-dehydropantoate 2-reductase|nr:ketopantoate reductase family protein [Prevotella sp.]
MKILIYGAGTIGCTYGWQLSEAGHEITILVRKGKKQLFETYGINIHCLDFRGGQKKTEQVIFRPEIIEELSPENDHEFIIVATGSLHLTEILPILKESAEKAHILFFQNIWDDFDEIARYLSPEQYFFGFPFMAGGRKNMKGINSIISGSKYSKTMLGEVNGKVTPRVRRIAGAMEEAGMKPFISGQITNWLIPHYVFIACLSAGILKTGGTMKEFISNRRVIKETTQAIREGFHICKTRGIDPKKEKVNKLYYLPLFISVPVVRHIFKNEVMALMFDAYLEQSTPEVRKMLEDIAESGEKYNIHMPYLKSLQKDINQ